MAGQDSDVDPAAMTAFAGRTHGVADRFETMRAGGAGTEAGRMPFRPLPASFQPRDICQQVAEACRTGLSDGYEAFEEIAGDQRRFQHGH
ncbi:hypothetical protein [Dactylosporangium sp. NPDC000521]|uniref:hypothetical protein n=1 Tax=Dactylosporangium sp. NPDC000521 TaxID=3363975 RepID=UPI003698D55E